MPDGLHDLLTGLRDRYGAALPPILITENGCSTADGTDDGFRIDYLDGPLRAVLRAIGDGVDVRGYSRRFGLVRVDFATQERTPKDSYRWLRAVLAER